MRLTLVIRREILEELIKSLNYRFLDDVAEIAVSVSAAERLLRYKTL